MEGVGAGSDDGNPNHGAYTDRLGYQTPYGKTARRGIGLGNDRCLVLVVGCTFLMECT